MWKVTYDWLDRQKMTVTSRDWDEDRFKSNRSEFVKIKLYDDDGNLYYDGWSDSIFAEEDTAFAPLDWATRYAGCTYMKYKDPKTKEWKVL
jgi:hypothetical protein